MKGGKQMKRIREKGITLIALVITTIVLLILAAVSIATLTGQNGILSRAGGAKEKNEIASVKEQARLDISNYIAEKLKNGEDSKVNTPEKVQEILRLANQNNENKYYKGFTETGVTTPSGYEVSYEELYTTDSSGEETTSKTIEDLVAGEKVYYDTGNTSVGNKGVIECIVLYDRGYNEENRTNYGIQIISSDIIKKADGTEEIISLGKDDPTVTGSDDFEKGKNSYNNALKILYDKAQEYKNSTYVSEARCVGSDPADPDWDTTANEAGYYTKEIAEQNDEYYSYMDSYYGILKNEDKKYNIDWTQMKSIKNVNIKMTSNDYWTASRRVYSNPNISCAFFVRRLTTSGNLNNDALFYVYSNGNMPINSYSRGFRPVFTLKPRIKVIDGDGKDIPYTLAV